MYLFLKKEQRELYNVYKFRKNPKESFKNVRNIFY